MKAGAVPWPLIMLAATGLAACSADPTPVQPDRGIGASSLGGSVGRGIGMILSAISGFVAFAGAVLGFKESGGDFNDLKDMNKLKARSRWWRRRVRHRRLLLRRPRG